MLVPALLTPRPLLRALAAALLLVGAGSVLAGPAAAHVSLTGSSPAADAQLATAPTEIELTYSAALLPVGNAVQVTGPSGPLPLEPLQVSERALVQPLPADLPPGAYTVQWRAASGDGHPIEGTFAFTSTAAPATSAADTSSPATTSAASSTSSTSADASSPGATAAQDEPTEVGDPTGGSSLPLWVGVPVALLGAAGVAAIALRRGRRPGEHE